MPQRLVDAFEPIQTQAEDGALFSGPLGGLDHAVETLHKIRPVGQTGQRIVQSLMAQHRCVRGAHFLALPGYDRGGAAYDGEQEQIEDG